jgi:alpha-tubulin suppressor-like RCC1 family protein
MGGGGRRSDTLRVGISRCSPVMVSAGVRVGTDEDWASVEASFASTIAVKRDGTIWAWGLNDHGQLGDGTTETRLTPVRVGTEMDWASVHAGDEHTVGTRTDGTLWAWGWNDYGQLGDGSNSPQVVPEPVP